MSAHTKTHLTDHELAYRVVIEIPGKKIWDTFVSERHVHKLEAFLEKYGHSDSTPWEELAADRIAKYKKAGLALRGARGREGMSQKTLAKKSGISQENISKIENGKRIVGEKVAKKLAKPLRMYWKHLVEE